MEGEGRGGVASLWVPWGPLGSLGFLQVLLGSPGIPEVPVGILVCPWVLWILWIPLGSPEIPWILLGSPAFLWVRPILALRGCASSLVTVTYCSERCAHQISAKHRQMCTNLAQGLSREDANEACAVGSGIPTYYTIQHKTQAGGVYSAWVPAYDIQEAVVFGNEPACGGSNRCEAPRHACQGTARNRQD